MSMSFRLRSCHYLLLIHPLLSHPDMLLSRIPRRNQRSMRMMRQRMVPGDYPMDGGDDGDDDDGDSSRDDAKKGEDDKDEDGEGGGKEEGALSSGRPTKCCSLLFGLFSPPEGTEPAKAERLLAMTTPSPSPPILLSPPSVGERLARCTAPPAYSSPPPMPSPLLPSSGCLTQIQTLRIASTQALIDAVTAALLSPPLPPLPPSLYILPHVTVGESSTARPTRDRGIDYGFVSTVDAEERRQGIRDDGYGIRDTWVDPAEAVPEIAPMQQVELAALRETGRRRQAQMVETLRVIRDMRREMNDMQTELLSLQEQQRRARQPGPEARIPDHQDAFGDAD
ncbi:hypothetical protein Tco_1065264, partial [Tanacetum coccineum]